MNESIAIPPKPLRRLDIDLLRVVATYLLLIFHVSQVFGSASIYHIRNADTSIILSIICGLIALWQMPLFFLLAGWSLHTSICRRSVAQFLQERVMRLLVPLLVGSVLFCPIIKYLELKNGLDLNHTGLRVTAKYQESFAPFAGKVLREFPPFQEHFGEFLPSFFTQPDRFSWSHLWFLAYLFTFTLLYLPLFLKLRGGFSTMNQVGTVWVYLPILPLALIQVFLRPHWPGILNLYNDWANFAYYSLYLMLGFVLADCPAWEQKLHQEWRRSLVLSVIAVVILLAWIFGWIPFQPIRLIASATAGWCLVVAWLGWANHLQPTPGCRLNYLVKSAYPVYLLHQVVIIVLGYWLVQTPWSLIPKWIVLLSSSFAVTLSLYEWIIKPLPWLYFMFGIKPSVEVSKQKA